MAAAPICRVGLAYADAERASDIAGRIETLMSAQPNETQQADGADLRFGSGHRAIRSEDAPLVTGRGQFTDDLDVAGQAHAAFVRDRLSPMPSFARWTPRRRSKMPGVLAVITGRDLAADNIGDIPPVASFKGRDGKPMFQATMPVLAAERVRYVGEAGRRS